MFSKKERDDTYSAPATKKKDEKEDKEKAVPGAVAVLAVALSIGLSGFISLVITDPDQGKTITLAEARSLQEQNIERIKNDPHMPPQAKRMALGLIERYRAVGKAMHSNSN